MNEDEILNIQVCWNLDDEDTKKREVRGLLHAGKELGCENFLIISVDKDGEEEIEWYGMKHRVKFKTLWKWLLEKEENTTGHASWES